MEFFGLVLPALIDLINRRVTNSDVRLWVSFFVCLVFGVFFNFVDTGFIFESFKAGFESITASVMFVFGLSQFSYKGIYEDSKLHKLLK